VPCDVLCHRCVDLPSVCTECVHGFELFGHSCIVPCGTLQFRASDGRSVRLCVSVMAEHCDLELPRDLKVIDAKVSNSDRIINSFHLYGNA